MLHAISRTLWALATLSLVLGISHIWDGIVAVGLWVLGHTVPIRDGSIEAGAGCPCTPSALQVFQAGPADRFGVVMRVPGRYVPVRRGA